MAKVLTFSLQKGGVGKSTSTGILAHLLAQEGHRVLVADMDSQGNVSDMLGLEPEDIEGKSIIEAFEQSNAKKFIKSVGHNIDLLPADDFLATFTKWLYLEYGPSKKPISLALFELLQPLQDDYDYILIDTPPSLGEHTVNAICASDYVVVLAESSKWAFTAIPRFLDTVNHAKKHLNENLEVAGILRTMNDTRRMDSKAFVELIGEKYPELVFDTIIKRKAATGRLSFKGFSENTELKEALEQYQEFYEELKKRIGVTINV